MTYAIVRSNSLLISMQTFLFYVEFTAVALGESRKLPPRSAYRSAIIAASACGNYSADEEVGAHCSLSDRLARAPIRYLDVIRDGLNNV